LALRKHQNTNNKLFYTYSLIVLCSKKMSIYKKLYIFRYMSINLGNVNITSARINYPDTMTATGGTISTITVSGRQYRVHTFTATGTSSFVTNNVSFDTMVDCLVVAGGGANGDCGGGGGGGGGLIYQQYKVSPSTSYTVIVGSGGIVTAWPAWVNGQNSKFATLTAIGGGSGGPSCNATNPTGFSGGSGGGGGNNGSGDGGLGTTGQGYAGARSQSARYAGGGGGAGAAGNAQFGGNGLQIDITGTSTYYAGGGGGNFQGTPAAAGLGGGGTANTGGGGSTGVNGGSGIVVIRYLLSKYS
jgi:hypothetical protein